MLLILAGGARAEERQTLLPPAPGGFDLAREGIEQGKIETMEYDSRAMGANRKMVVYTPPGYSANGKYPVVFLLHGVRYDETGWQQNGLTNVILDNLHAEKKHRVLWLSCDDKDGLMSTIRSFHTLLEEKKVPHVWHVGSGGHEWPVWKNDLHLFSQMLFRDEKAERP